MAQSPGSKSPPSPSELAQLEHAFAADPASDAYRPLAEAYLSMGRFMEAMVVCKKGVKAHPESAAARVLLARVYADQGKDKKALEELQGALGVAATDVPALRMTGALLCKTGDVPAGTEHLKKAAALAPNDPETQEICKKYGVEIAAPAPAPAPAPVAVAAPAPVPVPMAAAPVAAGPGPSIPVLTPQASAPPPPVLQPVAPTQNVAQPQPAHTNGTNGSHRPAQAQAPIHPAQNGTAPQQARPAQRPVSRPAQQARPKPPPVSFEELEAKYGGDDEPKKKSGAAGLIFTLAFIVLGAVGLGGYYFHAKATAERERKIDRLLKQVQEELGHDSFAGYKKACELGEQIVDLDPKLFSAHAYLSYAYALRWGEHGEGELAEKSARDHLEKAKAPKLEHSHIIAADAYIKFFSGQGQEAQADLERFTDENEKKGRKSGPLVTSTLGILEMQAGELDKALKNLKVAQALAPADARINSAVGNVLRRMGSEFLAANAYETALRYEKDHAEAQLGVALMAIDSGKIDTAEKYVNRLISADPPPSPRQLALARIAYAIVLDEQNKGADADKQEQLAFASDSKNPELFIMKSRRLLKAGKLDDAVTAIREAIKADPKRASFYVDLAKALVQKPGGAKEAVTSMQQALKTMPGSPKLLVLLGDAYRAAEDWDNAKDSYQKALTEAKDKLPEARMALADLAAAKKDWANATDLYEKAIGEYLTSPEKQAYGYVELGKLTEEQGDRLKAFDFYKKAAAADQSYAPAYYFIGRLLAQDPDRSRREKAQPVLEQYLQLAPKGQYADEAAKLMPKKK